MGVEGGGGGGGQGGGGQGGVGGEQGGGGAGLTRAAGAARDPGRCYRPAGGHMTVPRILEADSCTNTNTNTNSTNNYDNDNVGRGFNLIVIGFLGSEGISKSQGLRFAELQACPGGREGLRWQQQQQKVEEEEEEEGWLAVEALEAAASLLGVETGLVVQSLGLLQPLRVQPSQCQPTNLEVRLESSRPRRPRAPPWPPSSPASPARQVSRWGKSRNFLRQPPSHHHYRFRHAAHSHRLHYAQLTESLQREY